jgi:hypothetical protein
MWPQKEINYAPSQCNFVLNLKCLGQKKDPAGGRTQKSELEPVRISYSLMLEKTTKKGENMSEVNARILKILSLTQSTNDAEALLAIRKANRLLKKDGMSWKDFFQGNKAKKQTQQKDFFDEKKEEKDDLQAFEWAKEISEDFDYLEDREAVEDFVEGIKEFYNKKGMLTENQCFFMKNTYEKYKSWKNNN